MKIYQLRTTQQLPISLEYAWEFFSDPRKLSELTPSWMHFEMISDPVEEMYAGMIATYHLKPLLGIKLNWVTEITHVREHEFFVDEQRFGPYRFWHHEHHFKEVDGGTEMTDIVHYAMPFGIIGQAVHQIKVEKKLHEVFNFRYKTLEELFGSLNNNDTDK